MGGEEENYNTNTANHKETMRQSNGLVIFGRFYAVNVHRESKDIFVRIFLLSLTYYLLLLINRESRERHILMKYYHCLD